jgi:hypothetical protein
VRTIIGFVSALLFPSAALLAQSPDRSSAIAADSGQLRLDWLNSRLSLKPAAEPKAAPAKVAEPPTIGFRSNPQGIATRAVDSQSAEGPGSSPPPEKRAAEARPAEPPAARPIATESAPAKPQSAESVAKTNPALSPRPKAAPPATPPPPAVVREAPTAEKRTAKSQPTPKATSTLVARLAAPAVVAEIAPTKTRSAEARATPAFRSTTAPAPAPATAARLSSTSSGVPAFAASAGRTRYAWKTNIVTTLFWIGERPSANNPTPNHSSSWDVNWAQNYGGFDNPDPAARRNFIPVRFTPRQNPFYVALPYNDVTRGTAKPEARVVIPWFKEAFEREGQSVCRDRWVAIRNRAGRIAYAQWSDCGPFRTDHWQYVFGNERPRPNLNQGAGLDVSPAVRDYLGISSTDVTDWKFVDFKEVPSGPWARYGENNTFVQKASPTSPKVASR